MIGAAEKQFQSARARLALAGVALMRSDLRDGPVQFFAERNGSLKIVRTIEELESLLASAQSECAR